MSKRTSTFALMAILFASGAGTAMAADLAPPPPPPPAPEIRPVASDWTGPYIGAVAGVTCMDTRANYNVTTETNYVDADGDGLVPPNPGSVDPGDQWNGDTATNTVGPFDHNGCGFSGGFVGGFNYQMENIVFGIEGDFVWGSDNTGYHNNLHNTYLQRDRYDVDWMASVRLRAGILMNQSTLAYVTGGVGWMRGSLEDLNTGTAFARTHSGYVIGGGLEHALTENLHLRAEYLFSSYGRETYGTYCASCATDGDVNTGSVTVDHKMNEFHTFRVGLTWNFPISSW